MTEYFHDEIDLADIQAVESVIESRLEHYKKNYPQAFREIRNREDNNMTYIEFKDVDVDGCGADVTVIMEVSSDGLTNGTVERIKDAIVDYKREMEGEWDSHGCLNAAAKQFEKEGYKVRYIIPSTTICF